jgi:alpha-N-arabinofuranosidase
MDAHNSFDAPNTIAPAAFAAGNPGTRLAIDLPARSVVVVTVE